ncbi:MAG: adenylosuccinate lyase, partial [Cytophagales bacterium]|nr:adenylosuccinate lyase [Cytophagales bacterium]
MRDSLHALSPLDGRYFQTTKVLRSYFSEYALIQKRVEVEVKYFLALSEQGLPELGDISTSFREALEKIPLSFDSEDALRIKEIESEIRHDVKAVEIFLQEKIDAMDETVVEGNRDLYKAFVHFGLTSQDINNTAIPLLLKDSFEKLFSSLLDELLEDLVQKSKKWKNLRMLARTHGQPATPTLLGREIEVFYVRLKGQVDELKKTTFYGKFGGATGGMDAHFFAYPNVDWHSFAEKFLDGLGLKRSYPTTQIEHYDHLASFLDRWCRVHTILMDLAQDVWLYISLDYFHLKVFEKEVGSSTMPHKINPIDFENAEANLGIARNLCTYLSSSLPISRWQRDLRDSTILRNLGVCFGHSLVALKGLQRGLSRIEPHENRLREDLQKHSKVLAETIQTTLRKKGDPRAYDTLKALTRTNGEEGKKKLLDFVNTDRKSVG